MAEPAELEIVLLAALIRAVSWRRQSFFLDPLVPLARILGDILLLRARRRVIGPAPAPIIKQVRIRVGSCARLALIALLAGLDRVLYPLAELPLKVAPHVGRRRRRRIRRRRR